MSKNKDSKQLVNFSRNSEVAYFLWLKSGCPESIEEIAYFSMLQSGRPRGADRSIWNETKRRLEAHIRDNMGIPQPEVKVKKNSKSKNEKVVESVKPETKINTKEIKKSTSFKVDNKKSNLKKVSSLKKTSDVKSKIKKTTTSVADKNVISLKSVDVKVAKNTKNKKPLLTKKQSAVSKKVISKNVDEKVVTMPVRKSEAKKNEKVAVNK